MNISQSTKLQEFNIRYILPEQQNVVKNTGDVFQRMSFELVSHYIEKEFGRIRHGNRYQTSGRDGKVDHSFELQDGGLILIECKNNDGEDNSSKAFKEFKNDLKDLLLNTTKPSKSWLASNLKCFIYCTSYNFKNNDELIAFKLELEKLFLTLPDDDKYGTLRKISINVLSWNNLAPLFQERPDIYHRWYGTDYYGLRFLSPSNKKQNLLRPNNYRDYLKTLAYVSRESYAEAENEEIPLSFITEDQIVADIISSSGSIIYGEGGIGKTRLMYEVAGRFLNIPGYVVAEVESFVKDPQLLNLAIKSLFADYRDETLILLLDTIDELQVGDFVIEQIRQSSENWERVKIIATCRAAAMAGRIYADLLTFNISIRQEVERGYRDYVIKSIVSPVFGGEFDYHKFFSGRPAFAVFMRYWIEKNPTNVLNLGHVVYFSEWVEDRLKATFNKDIPYADICLIFLCAPIPQDVANLFSDKALTLLYEDGWLDFDYDSYRIPHATIRDEIVIRYFQTLVISPQNKLEKALNHIHEVAQGTNLIYNLFKAFNVVANEIKIKIEITGDPLLITIITRLNSFFSLTLERSLLQQNNLRLSTLRLFGSTRLLSEERRIDLFTSPKYENIFFPYLIRLEYSYSLAYSLVYFSKIAENKLYQEKLKWLFSFWHRRHSNFVYREDSKLVYGLVHAYICFFGVKLPTSIAFTSSFLRIIEPDRREHIYYIVKILKVFYQKNGHLHFSFNQGGVPFTLTQYLNGMVALTIERKAIHILLRLWKEESLPEKILAKKIFLKGRGGLGDELFTVGKFIQEGYDAKMYREIIFKIINDNLHENQTFFLISNWVGRYKESDFTVLVSRYLEIHSDKFFPELEFLFRFYFKVNKINSVLDFFLIWLKKNSISEKLGYLFIHGIKDPYISGHPIFKSSLLIWLEEYAIIYPHHLALGVITSAYTTYHDSNYLTYLEGVKDLLKNDGIGTGMISGLIDNTTSLEEVWPHVEYWLTRYSADLNASYVLVNYINKTGSDERISHFLKIWIENNGKRIEASHILEACLMHKIMFKQLEKVLGEWIYINFSAPQAGYIFYQIISKFPSLGMLYHRNITSWAKNFMNEPQTVASVLAIWQKQFPKIVILQPEIKQLLMNHGDHKAVFHILCNCDLFKDVDFISERIYFWMCNNIVNEYYYILLIRFFNSIVRHNQTLRERMQENLLSLAEKALEAKGIGTLTKARLMANWCNAGLSPLALEKHFYLLQSVISHEDVSITFRAILKAGGDASKIVKLVDDWFFYSSHYEPGRILIKEISSYSEFENIVDRYSKKFNILDTYTKTEEFFHDRLKLIDPSDFQSLVEIEDAFVEYLIEHNQEFKAGRLISLWIEKGGDSTRVEKNILEWLALYGSSRGASFVHGDALCSNNLNYIRPVQKFIEPWLNKFSKNEDAIFVLYGCLENRSYDLIKKYGNEWMQLYGDFKFDGGRKKDNSIIKRRSKLKSYFNSITYY